MPAHKKKNTTSEVNQPTTTVTSTLSRPTEDDLITSSRVVENLQVPRDRDGVFHTQLFERYSRFEPEIAEALTQMFVSGTSTHKVGAVAEKLIGVAPSASTVSRLNHTLTEQFEAWRGRPLLPHYRSFYLDGVHFTVRHGDQADSSIILTVLGVDLEGNNACFGRKIMRLESFSSPILAMRVVCGHLQKAFRIRLCCNQESFLHSHSRTPA